MFQDGFSIAGRKLTLRYMATEKIEGAKLEFKKKHGAISLQHLVIENITFEKSGNQIKQITINLPAGPSFLDLDQLVIVMDTTRTPVDLTLTSLKTV